jgi:uncharacterized membrane protein
LLIASAYLAAYFNWQRRAESTLVRNLALGLVVLANVATWWLLTLEVVTYFDKLGSENGKQLALTLLWTLYAIALLAVGIVRGLRPVRLAGLTLIALPVFKLFLVDVFMLEQGYRVAAFVSLGVVLLATGFIYQRYNQAIREFLFE